MRILQIGLGSMGKRRVRNLRALGVAEIVGFDRRKDRVHEAAEQYGIVPVASFEDGLAAEPHAVVCSCPPGNQLPYLEAALRSGKHVFNETNWVEDLASLQPLADARRVVAVPSFTMRFSQGVVKLREVLQTVGPVRAFVGHFGQHLALWHSWEDYRGVYYAQRETGGAREMVLFELQWIAHLLGGVERLSCCRARSGDLDCDIDDVYQVLVELRNGVLGSMQSDALSPTHFRWIRLVGAEAVVEWRDGDPIRLYLTDAQAWTDVSVPKGTPAPGYHAAEEMYVEELGLFLAATRGEAEYGYTYADYQRLAEALAAAEDRDRS